MGLEVRGNLEIGNKATGRRQEGIYPTPREGSRECGEGEGDCSLDSDCSGSLVCGTDNCLEQFSKSGERWGPGDDCCTRWADRMIPD